MQPIGLVFYCVPFVIVLRNILKPIGKKSLLGQSDFHTVNIKCFELVVSPNIHT